MLHLKQTLSFQNQRIEWGHIGSGPPLVLIHGTPFSAQVWRRIAPWLAERFTVYFFDLLGYGQSEMHAGQDVSLGVQNEVFAAFIKAWNIDAPTVVAHDFGGATALRAHYINGLTYKRLILIDPVAMAPWSSPLVQHVRNFLHAHPFQGFPGDVFRSGQFFTGAI